MGTELIVPRALQTLWISVPTQTCKGQVSIGAFAKGTMKEGTPRKNCKPRRNGKTAKLFHNQQWNSIGK